ncbi:MAG: hypothetical protein E7329_03000 [Clostridiales bacterium]|nr:hypothetical protein [Clostridiales bacterium]
MLKKNGFLLLLVALLSCLLLFCISKIAIVVPKPVSGNTAEPTSAAVPVSIDLVLPAPDVYFGLANEPQYASDKVSPIYSLDLVDYPAASIKQYISLLTEKYGLAVKPKENDRIEFTGTTLINDNGQECVEIQWLETSFGNRLMVSFGKNCATAALETLENTPDIRTITDGDWVACTKCGGENRCQSCEGRGRWRESDWDGYISKSCSVCNGDGKCHADGCINGRVFRPKEEKQ